MEERNAILINNAAYVNSQVMAANCEMEAMKAANRSREDAGLAQAYGEEHFTNLISLYGLGHNDVLNSLRAGAE